MQQLEGQNKKTSKTKRKHTRHGACCCNGQRARAQDGGGDAQYAFALARSRLFVRRRRSRWVGGVAALMRTARVPTSSIDDDDDGRSDNARRRAARTGAPAASTSLPPPPPPSPSLRLAIGVASHAHCIRKAENAHRLSYALVNVMHTRVCAPNSDRSQQVVVVVVGVVVGGRS